MTGEGFYGGLLGVWGVLMRSGLIKVREVLRIVECLEVSFRYVPEANLGDITDFSIPGKEKSVVVWKMGGQ